MITEAKTKVDELLDEAEKILDNAKSKTGEYVDVNKKKIESEGEKLKTAVKAGIDTYKSTKES